MTAGVEIVVQGRSGRVIYRDAEGTIDCHFEFGGGAVIAIVQAGDIDRWRARYAWALPRREAILRFIADDVIRRQAPDAQADIDFDRGDVLVRARAAAPPPPGIDRPCAGDDSPLFRRPSPARPATPASVAWYARLQRHRNRLAWVVLSAAIVAGALIWLKESILVVRSGPGVPIGRSVRIDTHVATLIRTQEPYTPSLHRDGREDRFRIGIHLVPLAGGPSSLTPIREHLSFNQFSLAKILGSDGRRLWFDVNGPGTLELATGKVDRTVAALPRDLTGATPGPLPPRPEAALAAGLVISPGVWFGLHSDGEQQRDYRPGQWVRRVAGVADGRPPRRPYRGSLEADTNDRLHRIVSITPLGDESYAEAALLRRAPDAEPIRLDGPDSVLMVHAIGTMMLPELVVTRLALDGTRVWETRTGIDRRALTQILPGIRESVFVGTRPPTPGKVPEPLLVIIDHANGTARQHSLWQP
ncbi:MAG: hypothetical protein R3E87_11305 [Burkholderiaceae bacterium]